mmetsp:Transcript_7469/g.30358  ORF Transcript_7469/g.30358 Transcript_7469/m.30358 type:complete len:218 (-) Transcript_7469:18-671(-)
MTTTSGPVTRWQSPRTCPGTSNHRTSTKPRSARRRRSATPRTRGRRRSAHARPTTCRPQQRRRRPRRPRPIHSRSRLSLGATGSRLLLQLPVAIVQAMHLSPRQAATAPRRQPQLGVTLRRWPRRARRGGRPRRTAIHPLQVLVDTRPPPMAVAAGPTRLTVLSSMATNHLDSEAGRRRGQGRVAGISTAECCKAPSGGQPRRRPPADCSVLLAGCF